jgi:hypothetical protein
LDNSSNESLKTMGDPTKSASVCFKWYTDSKFIIFFTANSFKGVLAVFLVQELQ